MMNSRTEPTQLFALQDCERLLAAQRSNRSDSKVVIDAEMLAGVVALAQQVRTWGG